MAIGRTFPESLQKGLRSLEQGRLGLGCDPAEAQLGDARRRRRCSAMVAVPTPERIFQVGELLRRGVAIEPIHEACTIDPWFLDQMLQIVEEREALADVEPDEHDAASVAAGQAARASATASSPTCGASTS